MGGDEASLGLQALVAWEDDAEIAHLGVPLDDDRDARLNSLQLKEAPELDTLVLEQRGPRQGLTLVHFSAQLERLLWDRGCA
jgi:hypothetical protein